MPNLARAIIARLAVLAVLALAACSVDDPSFTGIIDASSDGNSDADVIDGPPGTVNLTIVRDGTATGAVTSNPGGINCGTDGSGKEVDDDRMTDDAHKPACGVVRRRWHQR